MRVKCNHQTPNTSKCSAVPKKTTFMASSYRPTLFFMPMSRALAKPSLTVALQVRVTPLSVQSFLCPRLPKQFGIPWCRRCRLAPYQELVCRVFTPQSCQRQRKVWYLLSPSTTCTSSRCDTRTPSGVIMKNRLGKLSFRLLPANVLKWRTLLPKRSLMLSSRLRCWSPLSESRLLSPQIKRLHPFVLRHLTLLLVNDNRWLTPPIKRLRPFGLTPKTSLPGNELK